MISKNKIRGHTSEFQKTNQTGSVLCGMPRTQPSFHRLETWLVCRVEPPQVPIYVHEILLKSYLTHIKGENPKIGVTKKHSTPNFPKNEHSLHLDKHTCVCVSEGKKCSFLGKLCVLCLLVTPVLRFALLAYCRRNISIKLKLGVVIL